MNPSCSTITATALSRFSPKNVQAGRRDNNNSNNNRKQSSCVRMTLSAAARKYICRRSLLCCCTTINLPMPSIYPQLSAPPWFSAEHRPLEISEPISQPNFDGFRVIIRFGALSSPPLTPRLKTRPSLSSTPWGTYSRRHNILLCLGWVLRRVQCSRRWL